MRNPLTVMRSVRLLIVGWLIVLAHCTPSSVLLAAPAGADGDGSVTISGELKQWHKVTVTMAGPFARESDNSPNSFTDIRMTVNFRHASGKEYTVPGYFAADGDAANSSATAGNKWRAHLAPDQIGRWEYVVHFEQGEDAALDRDAAAKPIAKYDRQRGEFEVVASDKTGRDFRNEGRLDYVGKHYLRYAGSGRYFLKAGADAPETLLAYVDFDGTLANKPKKCPLKTWSPHVRDWSAGDPTWKDGKGKGLIGAVNYLSGKGCNAFSFLPYNAGGDGDNVWPFVARNDKLHYDCSKLDQWGIIFDHGTRKGMYLHFKLQETENDDNRQGKSNQLVPESLDGGDLGVERKLYLKELIARYGHNLALNWNLGEENTQTTAQQKAMGNYIAKMDAYKHHIVVHTFPNQQEKVYKALMGPTSPLTGVSLQNNHIKETHWQTAKWVEESAKTGKPWVVAFDESGSAAHGQCPDLGYHGFDGHDNTGKMAYTEHEVRQQTLWGTLMAGGAGVEYYFGYQFVENDLLCEDWRSRDHSWDYCRIALDFFRNNDIPFPRMKPADELIGNPQRDNSKYCFALPGEIYVVYLPTGGTTTLNLGGVEGEFAVAWFNPRVGGELHVGTQQTVAGGTDVGLGEAPAERNRDWAIIVRKR